jgi:hypothetical protein
MPYKLEPGEMYRMPTHFGPRTGPRRGPDGQRFECVDSPKTTAVSLSFLSDPAQLDALLPPGFALSGEPLVSVTALYQKDIEWLAGRGYNILGVRIPAVFTGQRDNVAGNFLAVLWENLADPIITGREELGYAKVFAELPKPEVDADTETYSLTASWLGFRFFDMTVTCPTLQTEDEIEAYLSAQTSEGDLHYKYMPRTGDWGDADVACITHSPAKPTNLRIRDRLIGEGALQFHHARWEDMPTQYNIVNALSELTINEYRGASVTRTVGGKDLKDTRILR